jgi:hypothetical protein
LRELEIPLYNKTQLGGEMLVRKLLSAVGMLLMASVVFAAEKVVTVATLD